MQLANSWRRMVWVVLSVPFVVYFALDTAKPGRGASDAELATIRATAVIRGQCENGANCMYLTSQPPDVVNGMCIDNGSDGACGTTEGKYCGSCTGAADQVCTANPSSPYFCDDALPNQNCCDINKSCETVPWFVFWFDCTCTGTPAAPFTAVTRKRC